MILRNLSLLFIFMILIGCNQSDTNTDSTSEEQAGTPAQTSSYGDNTGEPEERTGKIVARVNGFPIYEEDLERGDLDFIINEEIIYQIGLKKGLDKKYKDRVRKYEKSLIVRNTKAEILANAEPTKQIPDEMIQQYYDNNKRKYTHARIHEISFSNPKLGEEIKSKAEKGEDLQEIANSYADESISVRDIGFNREMVRNLNDNIEVGTVSDVVQKPNGTFSILKIVEIKEIPLSVSKRSIRHILETELDRKMYDNYIREAANENSIEIEIIK